MIVRITRLFPLWAVLLSAIALYSPSLFAPGKPYIIPLLVCIMFCMGMTLKWDDFKNVSKRPLIILLAVFLQYAIMPFIAWGLSKVFWLDKNLFIGMILVGSASGGTASNVITYLAKGNVALSITCTLVSTLLAVIMLPSLSLLYLQQTILVDFWGMMQSIAQIVLIPVLLGTGLNSLLGKYLEKTKPLLPLFSVIAIVVIIAIIVGLNAEKIHHMGILLMFAVILHNSCGLLFGYLFPKLLKQDSITCRTIAIEVGMQNSGLAVALAIKYFSYAAALPGAIFSIWHNISGSILAAYWSKDSE